MWIPRDGVLFQREQCSVYTLLYCSGVSDVWDGTRRSRKLAGSKVILDEMIYSDSPWGCPYRQIQSCWDNISKF